MTLKLCFLILAHHEPVILDRLVRALDYPGADVVVHIDERVQRPEFQLHPRQGLYVMDRRIAVNWTGWSLAEALINGLEYSLEISDADYFIYLAGTDYPLKSAMELVSYLEKIHPLNLLNHYPLVPGIWGHGLIDRFRLIDLRSRFEDLRLPFEQGLGFEASAARALEEGLNARFMPRDTQAPRFFHGSSRWCLNRSTVGYIVDHARSDASAALRDYLYLSANADEIFIPTAVFNSEFRWSCMGYDETETEAIFAGRSTPLQDEKRVYLHYIDWSSEREDPAILDERDLPALRQSEKFFACKFLAARSLGLLDILERDMARSEWSNQDQ